MLQVKYNELGLYQVQLQVKYNELELHQVQLQVKYNINYNKVQVTT